MRIQIGKNYWDLEIFGKSQKNKFTIIDFTFQLLLLNIDYFYFSGKRKTSYQRGENPRDGASTKGQKRPKERKQTKTEFCPYAQNS